MIIDVEDLRGLCEQVLGGHGLSEEDAHIVTDILIEAELRGRPTHGVIRMPGIVQRLQGLSVLGKVSDRQGVGEWTP